jgi:hypothetical protein
MRTALLVIAGLALVGYIVVAFVLPQMAGSEAKEAARTLLAGTNSAQQQVAAAAQKAGKLDGSGNGIKLAPKSDDKLGGMKWLVDPNGTVHGWNDKNAIEITLTPSLHGGKVDWHCRGYPIDAMPASCGGH